MGRGKSNKKIPYFGAVIILILLIVILISSFTMKDSHEEGHTYEESDPEHIHGIYSLGNDVIYIATHNGLMKYYGDHIDKVGESTDDFMSFVVHPEDSSIMFASGHSNDEHEDKEDYANLNVIKSTDSGLTWTEISKAVNGPVDFHAMGISEANPDIMYGWFRGLQRSLDGGYNWETLEAQGLYETLIFESHPENENIVYAATLNGLVVSSDKGETWEFLSDDLSNTAIISLSLNPKEPTEMLSNSVELGFAKSEDGGKSWEKINEDFEEELVTYMDFDPLLENKVFAITKENSIFVSLDSGETWERIFEN